MFSSSQAKVSGIASLISIMLSSFAVGLTSGAKNAILVFLFSVAITALYVFDVECTVIGDCSIWGWIKTIMIILGILVSVIISVVVIVLSIAGKRPKNTEDTQKN